MTAAFTSPVVRRLALVWCLGGYALLSAACSEAVEAEPPKHLAATRCSDALAAEAARPGVAGDAWLLYPCEGSACTGEERFTRGQRHTIQVEAGSSEEAVLLIRSDDEAVAAVFDVVSAFDPCAGKLKAWATLEARSPGETRLTVRDANGDIDSIPIGVAEPAQIRLRATPSESFAFRGPISTLVAAEGESWLLFPELFDARGALLIGQPQLTWSIDDPRIAELRTPALAAAPDSAMQGALEVRAKAYGETVVKVRAQGVETHLRLRVTAP